MELQSGFVLAVIVAAVLLVDRIGGAPELARRLFQVALGVLLAFLVVAGTNAFIRPPELTEAEFELGSSEDQQQQEFFEDFANRNSAKQSINVGAGVIALVLGIAWMRRWSTLPLGVTLGGLLLILFGGLTQPTNTNATDTLGLFYSAFLGVALGSGSQAADIAHFVMLLGGSAALLLFGYREWERGGDASPGEEAAA